MYPKSNTSARGGAPAAGGSTKYALDRHSGYSHTKKACSSKVGSPAGASSENYKWTSKGDHDSCCNEIGQTTESAPTSSKKTL